MKNGGYWFVFSPLLKSVLSSWLHCILFFNLKKKGHEYENCPCEKNKGEKLNS